MTQILKKISVGALISLVALGSLMVIPASHVSAIAAPTDISGPSGSTDLFNTDFSTPEQARIWTSIQAALSENKASACQFDTIAPESQIASGNWFTGKVSIGYHVEPDDGYLQCSNENKWFSKLLDQAGYEGDYLSLADQVLKPSTVDGNTYYAPRADSRAILRGIFEQKFFGGSQVLRGGTPDYLTYSIMFANFTASNACKAKVAPTSPNALAQLKGDGWLEQSIFVSEDGKTVQKDYVYDNRGGDGMHVGYNLPGDGGDDGQFKCSSIATILHDRRYADALATYAVAHPNTPTTDPNSVGDSASDASLNCGSKLAVIFNPANWLMCPIVEGLATLARALDNGINNMLTIDTSTSGETSIFNKENGYYAAWQQMRIYAIIFLVIATLVVVISQALGFEFLDAYTMRKVLPRLLIAAVAISISWELMVFFVQLANDLGTGIRAIIYAPFSKLEGANLTIGGGGLFIADLVGAGALAALGVFGLLSFVATAALAVAVAFFVLVLRQLLITVLIILAPVAIVCYILPNTQKAWKLWWESFSKALLMFPLITAFIATGRVVAATALHKGGSLNSFIAFVAYFAPYFLIPLTFRFAGGLLGNLGGFVNNRSRGVFDGLKNYRSNQSKQRRANGVQRAKTGNVFKYASEGSVGDRLNKGVQRTAHLRQGRLRPGQFKSSIEGAVADTNYESGLEAAEKLPGARSFFASDDLMAAGVEGAGDYEKTRTYLEKTSGWTPEQAQLGASQAIRLRSQMGSQAFDLAAVAKLPGTGTYAVGENIGEWHQLVAKVSGGNKSLQASLVAQGKAGFRSAQRYEVSEAGFKTHLDAIQMAADGASIQEISNKISDSALESGGAAAVVGVRNDEGARVFAGAARRMLSKATTRGEELRALAMLANIQDQSAGGKKIVTDVLATELFGYNGIGGKTILQQINEVRDLPEFQQARRELGRDIPPELQNAARQQGQGQTPGTPTPPAVGGPLQPPLG